MNAQNLATILIIEDDKLVRDMTREHLQNRSFIVLEALSLQRGLDIAEQHKVDAILLDLNLGQETSLPHIPEFKSRQDVPVLVVSGEQDDNKKIRSFELGADDFVEKPFNPDLLAARLRTHIQKTKTLKKQSNNDLFFSPWRLDTEQRQAFHDDERSAGLTFGEYTVLEELIKNAGKVIKREELAECLAKQNYVPNPRAIDIKITRIRQKLEDKDATVIKTIRGVGYLFNPHALSEN